MFFLTDETPNMPAYSAHIFAVGSLACARSACGRKLMLDQYNQLVEATYSRDRQVCGTNIRPMS